MLWLRRKPSSSKRNWHLGKGRMAMPRTGDNGFDAAVVGRENHVVALVEVKAHPVERWAPILPRQLAEFAERVAFVLTIDPNRIQLYRPGGESPRGADCST
jgi:hypothetical protein